MAKRALITGITGQDGAFLARLLLEKGYEVHGGARRTSLGHDGGRLAELGVADAVTLHYLDLHEMTNIQRVLDRAAPDEVYNLAAQSFVAVSFEQPLDTADVDALGALRMLEAVRQSGAKPRFYQASTSEMFGNAPTWPQDEATPFRPRSPYGVAKTFAHHATVNYREAHGLHASCGILFNHESELRGAEFVTRKITRALARLAHGGAKPVLLGNLSAERDWGYAPDFVEGIWRMCQAETADDYVLATGRSTSVRDFVGHAAAALGFRLAWRGEGIDEEGFDEASGRLLARVDRGFWRPAEIHRLVGEPRKAREKLGWSAATDARGVAEIMAEADLRRLRDAAAEG